MVELTGDTTLCGVVVRELLARGLEVSGAPLDADARPTEGERIIVVAEGQHDLRETLAEAVRAVELWGGALLFATGRSADDPVVLGLRRRGVPYTIVRSSGLIELPDASSMSFVLVPSDLSRAPFATLEDLASKVGEVVASNAVGSGTLVDVTSHAGADDWASALREAGARAFVVPRWVALIAGMFGARRLDVVGHDVRFVTGARVERTLPALGA
jgi:hypothetical protein